MMMMMSRVMPKLTMTIKALTVRMMIDHMEDNKPSVDGECDDNKDNNKSNIDIVQSIIFTCRETTEGTQFDTLLEMVADLGRCIFKLFQVQTSFHWKKMVTVIQTLNDY